MPPARKPHREARFQKPKPHLNTDIAAVKNATDMDDAKERTSSAWPGADSSTTCPRTMPRR